MKARQGCLLAMAVVASSWMGCAHQPVGYQVPGTAEESVTVLSEGDVPKTGLPAWSLAIPLGENQDESVLHFLERADASGAKYLTDVNVVFASEKNGQQMECRTHFLPTLTVENRPAQVTRRVQDPSGYWRLMETKRSSTESPPYFRHDTDIVRYQEEVEVQRWRLLKTDPECKPLESGSPLVVAGRVEGRAYGCGDSTSGCQDKTL
jgi:hypothetical protein